MSSIPCPGEPPAGSPSLNAALLLLTDSRLPAGGHGHSGGAEAAIAAGAVHDLPTLAAFLRGRLATSGLVAACLAAAACALATSAAGSGTAGGTAGEGRDRTAPDAAGLSEERPGGRAEPDVIDLGGEHPGGWAELDAEADARTASPAQREASRVQGRLLLRTARRIWPAPVLDELAEAVPHGAHHPVALGAAAGVTGCTPQEAALAAAYTAVTGPATAAVRLLGLDPVEVHRLLADLAPDLERIAATAACLPPIPAPPAAPVSPDPAAGSLPAAPPSPPHRPLPSSQDPAAGSLPAASASPEPPGGSPWAALPAHAAPALDLLAERHLRAGLRLFVS
ncbi:urease accessory protein UreF [Planobispora takensis]|uniref:Urease accessory protein UreF n=1 Tax=Planobispora takensis TaxID=1367882 RepID=A0A8J3WRV3_9ACTN|nr:urease accessory UreF family protein [Planobispora takensis]GIH98537.1 hypothetical protein Pta02_05460 [Planobispora takensis]